MPDTKQKTVLTHKIRKVTWISEVYMVRINLLAFRIDLNAIYYFKDQDKTKGQGSSGGTFPKWEMECCIQNVALFLSLFIQLLLWQLSYMLSAIFCHLEIKNAIWQIWHNLVEMPFKKSRAKMTKHWLKSPEARDVEGICPFRNVFYHQKVIYQSHGKSYY